MESGSVKNNAEGWNELAAQQLIRYEALFKLIDEIHVLEDIALISKHVARQWKYFANVGNWRLTVFKNGGYQIIDGFRGEAHIDSVTRLSAWDRYHCRLKLPRLLRVGDTLQGPPPPDHLAGKAIAEIQVLPFMRANRWIALLSTAARHVPFSDLDNKFIRIFGSHFADRISDSLFRRQATESLIQKASRDALTGLLNRGTIIERLDSQLALARRTGQPLSVVLADIDFFKVINDSHGHLAGDEVLREVSRRLQAQTRDSDSNGRYGGEEFLFVLFPCGAEDVMKAAERFRRAIADTPVWLGPSAGRITVTISLGTASTCGRSAITMEALLKQADNALYHSKANGRNRVTLGNQVVGFAAHG